MSLEPNPIFLFLKDLFIDPFFGPPDELHNHISQRGCNQQFKNLTERAWKQPKQLYQHHSDLFNTSNDLLPPLVYARSIFEFFLFSFFFFFPWVSSEKSTHAATIVFYSHLCKVSGFKSSLINKKLAVETGRKVFFFLSSYSCP